MIDFESLSLIAEYKNGELTWKEGRDINAVYTILIGDEYYIGSSHYTYLRISQHLKALLSNSHHSPKMQEAFAREHDFKVFVIERGIDNKELLYTEGYYINKYKPSLNIDKPSFNKNELRIEALLKERGLTKTALSEMLGVKKQNLNGLMKNPTLETIKKFADVLGVPIWQLFTSPDEVAKEINGNIFKCPHCGNLLSIRIEKGE